ERERHDARVEHLPAYVDLDRVAGLQLRRHECQCNAVAQGRRKVSARHRADFLAVANNPASLAWRPPAFGREAAEATGDSLLPLPRERRPTAEVRLVPADDPAEPRLQRRDPGAELVAVQ